MERSDPQQQAPPHPDQPINDNPRYALEEGEPSLTRRSHGRDIDDEAVTAAEDAAAFTAMRQEAQDSVGDDWESGRQQAMR